MKSPLTLFILVSSSLLCAAFDASAHNPMNLTGLYHNTLGSEMYLECVESGAGAADLSGWYQSAVGKATGVYSLAGKATYCGPDAQLSFSVAWNNQAGGNSYSTTAWSAQAIPNFPLMLYATWLLTSETAPGNDWQSTNIGYDVFIKTDSSSSTIS